MPVVVGVMVGIVHDVAPGVHVAVIDGQLPDMSESAVSLRAWRADLMPCVIAIATIFISASAYSLPLAATPLPESVASVAACETHV